MRAQYLRNRDMLIELVTQHFPENIRMSYPQGGYLLWISLDESIDTSDLNKQLARHGFSIAPGSVFTAAKKFNHCLRLNYAQEITPAVRNAIAILGQVIKDAVAQDTAIEDT